MSLMSNSPLLVLPGLIYEGLARVRNGLYDSGLLAQQRLPRPVISIGNLTLGGTGKTPLVIYLADLVAKLGALPALLSRGYARNAPRDTVILTPGEQIEGAASVLGDEPALIRLKVPSLCLGISANRYGAGRRLLERGFRPIFLLDDGFQHRRLHRNLDIVIVDRTQALERNRIFPAGTLREPLASLSRAHIVVLHGTLQDPRDPWSSLVQKANPGAHIFECTLRIEALVPFASWKGGADPPTHAECGSAFLVAAIGNPARFQGDVAALGVSARGARFYRDHHRITEKDWRDCEGQALQAGADVFITTEKDAIKLDSPPGLPLLVSVQTTRVTEGAAFAQIIRKLIEEAG